MLNVSERSVKAARVVRDHAAPALADKVERGEVSVSAAADVARLPVVEQVKIVARGELEILTVPPLALTRNGRYRERNKKGCAMRSVRMLVVSIAFGCAACTLTEPVVVIGANGLTLRGTATATLNGGSFTVTNGTLTCGGSYDSLSFEATITMPVLCSDGRKGIVIATRDSSGTSGHGRVRMTDGTEADFIFGPSAANF